MSWCGVSWRRVVSCLGVVCCRVLSCLGVVCCRVVVSCGVSRRIVSFCIETDPQFLSQVTNFSVSAFRF